MRCLYYLGWIWDMSDFSAAMIKALTLIASNDAVLREIVTLSLEVSLTASLCALVIGAPLGTALAVYRFRGRGAPIVVANGLFGLPPVVVGLASLPFSVALGAARFVRYSVHAGRHGHLASRARTLGPITAIGRDVIWQTIFTTLVKEITAQWQRM
jgi:ABC-type spermidine/putrescine transport system permease subunit II